MIHSDETQKLFREKSFINENEIVITSGDLILVDKNIVSQYLNLNNISESKSNSQLLKG